MHTRQVIEQGYQEEIDRLLFTYQKVVGDELDLSEEEALELGRQAARTAFAPFIWKARVGDTWDVRQTAEFLGISRQALYKRVRTGTALGVPGRGTTHFPVWQFDTKKHLLRPVVAEIIAAFREADKDLSPLTIAAWVTASSDLLDGRSPAGWIALGSNDQGGPDFPASRVVTAAHRAAAGLAA